MAEGSPWADKRVLLLSTGATGEALAAALATHARLTAVSPRQLVGLLLSGRWRSFDGVCIVQGRPRLSPALTLLLRLWHWRGMRVSVWIQDPSPLLAGSAAAAMAAFARWAAIVYLPSRRFIEAVRQPKARVLPPAGQWRQPAGSEHHGVICVGGVTPESGVPVLLEAAGILAGESRDFHLTIVCPEPESLGAWRERPWLTVKAVSGDALGELLALAAVAVVPLPRHPDNELGLPAILLDYLACGLPVVVTDCLETADFVRRTKVGEVVPATTAGLAAGLRRLLDHPTVRRAKSAAAQAAIQGAYGWDHRAKTMLADLFPAGRTNPLGEDPWGGYRPGH